MSKNHHRTGNPARTLLVVFCGSMLVPILMAGVWATNYQVASVSAQDTQARDQAVKARTEIEKAKLGVETARAQYELEKARLEAEQARAHAAQRVDHPIETTHPPQKASGAPVASPAEPQRRPGWVTVYAPDGTPKTSRQVLQKRRIEQWAPAAVQHATGLHAPPHDPNVMRLAGELREMNQDDPQRAAKLNELRTRLDLEFSRMHEHQGKEIERTEQRLESLKKLHQRRGENQDKIVQRRIDELLGKSDDLRWNPVPAHSQPPGGGPHYSAGPAVPQHPRIAVGIGTGAETRHVTDQVTQQSTILRQEKAPEMSKTFRVRISGDPTAKQSGPPPRPGTAATRGRPSTSVIGDVFRLARNSATANLELRNARHEWDAIRALRAEGAVTSHEAKKTEMKFERIRQQVELNRAELEAMADALHRDLEFAEEMHEQAVETLEMTKSRFDSGTATSVELASAENEVRRTLLAHTDAKASVRQLQIAMELVERSAAKEESDDPRQDDDEIESPTERSDEERE